MANGSTIPRRALGRELRKLRKKIPQADAARAIGVSPPTYSRLEEGGITKVSDLYINTLCNEFGASDEERRQLLDLVQEIRETPRNGAGWWRADADVLHKGFDHYLALEEAAHQVTSWQSTLVPGLLQTRDYRRELLWAEFPDMPTEEVERFLDVVMTRQDGLARNDFHFEAILAEAVLRSAVGGPSVMAGQLERLIEASELPTVSVRIVPFHASSPIGLLTRSFVLFRFPPLATSKLVPTPIVYQEGFVGGLYLERDAEVSRYVEVTDKLQHVASSKTASRDLVSKIMKEWKE